MTPQRIQRKRTKGWKAPEGAVYVGRPTKWGNPYAAWSAEGRQRATDAFRHLLQMHISCGIDHPFHELRGKDLMCWCPLSEPCHADVLLELANAPDAHP